MADLKDTISVTLAGHLAQELTTAWPEFPERRFTRGLGDALDPLALMARVDLLVGWAGPGVRPSSQRMGGIAPPPAAVSPGDDLAHGGGPGGETRAQPPSAEHVLGGSGMLRA